MIAVIPARGGSQEVRRKNLAVVDGKPLLCHISDTLKAMGIRVIVSTEDSEIASVAKVHGYEVHHRDKGLADDQTPVADVAAAVVNEIGYKGPVLVAQPTCPFVTQETLSRLINMLGDHDSATLVTNTSHLRYGPNEPRISRQLMPDYHEVGVRVFADVKLAGDFPEEPVHVEGREAYDIDTIHELRAAQTTEHTIEISVIGNERVGSGHVRRGLALANELQHHNVSFFTGDSELWVDDMIEAAGWEIDRIPWPPADLVILDRLDTTRIEVGRYRANGSKVVTIEDLGSGAWDADLVVNAMYPDRFRGDYSGHLVSGPQWADLRPEFIGLPNYQIWDAKRILCMFGGTDPSHLGERVAKALTNVGDVTLIPPHADAEVAFLMMEHDVLVTSAGRTVYEAAAVGIPTVVIAQNAREASHVHLGNANLYLGIGSVVTDEQIQSTVRGLLADTTLREDLSMSSRKSVDGLGLQRIAWRVEGLLRNM